MNVSLSILLQGAVAEGLPFTALVQVRGAPAGAHLKVTLRAKDDPSLPPVTLPAQASQAGEAQVRFAGLVLRRPGSRLLTATADDDIGLQLGSVTLPVNVS